ncbi:hypothetical protein [Paenibacillus jiagnxiensis]|uniref:hypothetical protein n=1 Tax=Paenibacillus jiagnxiensis TaxID=3228926 RepID=UPI0033AB2E4D
MKSYRTSITYTFGRSHRKPQRAASPIDISRPQITMPPATSIRWALNHLNSSVHNEAMTPPISSGTPTLPNAVCELFFSLSYMIKAPQPVKSG